MSDEVLSLKKQEYALLLKQEKFQRELPHLYGMPWYKWAHEYFDSRSRKCFLTAGNQLSKSSTQIRKCIHWATAVELWPELWPNTKSVPNVMWYFYPTSDVAEEEWNLKWSQFMPHGDMKEHPVFGWNERRKNNKIYAVEFNSGMTIIFKTYAQSVTDIQTGTVFAIFLDEECPLSHLPEIQSRLNSTDGYLSMVFTATLGQEYWRKTIEGSGAEELNPDADKWQITLFDCIEYEDGSASPWTFEKVKRAVLRAASDPQAQGEINRAENFKSLRKICEALPDSEVQRRILGRFVYEGGTKIKSFSRERNVCKRHVIPSDWIIYSSVDYGSGGEDNHPAAMSFLGVSPDFKMGRIFKVRRMDGITTTAQDVLDEYILQRGEMTPLVQTYDWSSKDFHTFAMRRGEGFVKADKDHEAGYGTLSTLLKSGMLKFFDDDPEIEKLITEIVTLKATTLKRDAKDDLIDTVRYNCLQVPWDWSVLDEISFDEGGRIKEPQIPREKTETDLRRDFHLGIDRETEYTPDVELSEWDEMLNDFDS